MHDHPSETLRGKDPTADGRHLHEPDGFPHSMIAVMFLLAILIPIIVGALYVSYGVGTAAAGGVIMVLIGVPYVVVKINRSAQHWRRIDELEEREVEDAEALGVPPPKNSIDQINERWNRSPYDETVPRTVPRD